MVETSGYLCDINSPFLLYRSPGLFQMAIYSTKKSKLPSWHYKLQLLWESFQKTLKRGLIWPLRVCFILSFRPSFFLAWIMDVLTTAIIWLKCDLDKESHVLRMKNQDHDRNLSSDSRVANKNIRHPSLICISDKQQQKFTVICSKYCMEWMYT